MSGISEADYEELRNWARQFARNTLSPQAELMEREGAIPPEFLVALCKKGLGGAILPQAVGGAGLDYRQALAVFEDLAYGDMPTAFSLLCQNSCARSIWQYGTESQRQRWLPALMAGETFAAYAITEADAGSDPASMSTTAVRGHSGWVLDGRKALITNAPVAGLFVLSARSPDEARSKAITSFLVPAPRPGLDASERQQLSGAKALQVGCVALQACEIEDAARLGPQGQGMRIALDAVNWARMIWGGLAVGVAQAALDNAVSNAKTRTQFGRPLLDFQSIAFKLADLATEIVAARQLAQHAAEAMDRKQEYVTLCAMTKRFVADMAVKVTTEALELQGGWGYVATNPLDRLMRQARLAQLADGASNIQRLVIARSL